MSCLCSAMFHVPWCENHIMSIRWRNHWMNDSQFPELSNWKRHQSQILWPWGYRDLSLSGLSNKAAPLNMVGLHNVIDPFYSDVHGVKSSSSSSIHWAEQDHGLMRQFVPMETLDHLCRGTKHATPKCLSGMQIILSWKQLSLKRLRKNIWPSPNRLKECRWRTCSRKGAITIDNYSMNQVVDRGEPRNVCLLIFLSAFHCLCKAQHTFIY